MNLLKRSLSILGHTAIVVLLTIVTQIGGFIWLLSRLINRLFPELKKHWSGRLTFPAIYLLTTLLVVPLLAPRFGRTALPISPKGDIAPLSYLTILSNRHYVKTALYDLMDDAAQDLNRYYPESQIAYLDACFPFGDGFPLLPHLSHNDGEKVDIAFLYADQSGQQVNRTGPSWIGYGAFERPMPSEKNHTDICTNQAHALYNMTDYLVPDWAERDLLLDENRTAALIRILSNHPATGKILLEPHLVSRWKVAHYKVRFQGCHAVRHDDHLHLQL